MSKFIMADLIHIDSYLSIAYLAAVLPVAIIIYSLMPKKAKPYSLLALSYIFFWLISEKLIIYLIISTLSVYFAALLLKKLKGERSELLKAAESRDEKKLIKKKSQSKQLLLVLAAAILNIGILATLKYSTFFLTNINSLFKILHTDFAIEIPKLLAPIGISFYTLQAVSYIHDVYKEKLEADNNLGRVALFMAFFPIIMEGPICRYQDTAEQLWQGEAIKYKNLTYGIQRILFGMLKKIVIADRLNIIVKTIFKDFSSRHYDGGIIALGAVLYTIMLYCEFSGTIDVVIGSGEIFGVKIPENFRQPFFSRSITEFWQRWHITLGTWFRDYIFYPVTMSKPLKKLTKKCRKKLGREYGPMPASIIAFLCVWLCNGLWHGAGWQFIFFGIYHFALISLGSLLLPISSRALEKLHIKRNGIPYTIFTVIRTSILVCIGEMFFNAHGLTEGFKMFRLLITSFSLASFKDGSVFTIGFDRYDLIIMLVALAIVIAVGAMKEKGISPRDWIAEKAIYIRWPIYLALIIFIVIFGAYGTGYIPIDPIYANF